MSDLKKPDRTPTPDAIEGVGEPEIEITWSDGDVTRYDAHLLRGSCMCAECVEEVSGKRRVGPDDVPPGVTAERFQQVGSYAVRIYWSDGHSTGIYPFEKLREMAEEA